MNEPPTYASLGQAINEDSAFSISLAAYKHCELCPRRCRARRSASERGICGQTSSITLARAALHHWEEPPISGTQGSGTIFFSGCPLACSYCQNKRISTDGVGTSISTARLAAIMLELQAAGAHNINIVTGLHFAPQLVNALDLAKHQGLCIPIVANSSGYERTQLVDALADYIDIWLVDFKYASSRLAQQLSRAANYPHVAQLALTHMLMHLRRRGGRQLDTQGIMQQGIIVRHLVLPSYSDDSLRVLDTLAALSTDEFDLSVMNQYTPNEQHKRAGGPLSQPLSVEEYERVLDYADELGFETLWWQEGGTVSESFIPEFDATGVEGPELYVTVEA